LVVEFYAFLTGGEWQIACGYGFASVTEMLKKLAEEGYVKYSPYHGSALTEKGIKEA